MRTIPLRPGRHVIGRAKGADLRIGVDTVSREHCEIVVEGAGVGVRDLGSSNGTFVNCQRVDQKALSAGDLIAVGPAVLVVRIDGEPDEIDPYEAFEDGAPSVSPGLGGQDAEADGETASGAPTTGVSISGDALEGSSLVDFDFSDLEDDEDEQPSL